jgi:hypothetical protein
MPLVKPEDIVVSIKEGATLDEISHAYMRALIKAGYTSFDQPVTYTTPTGETMHFTLKFSSGFIPNPPSDKKTDEGDDCK